MEKTYKITACIFGGVLLLIFLSQVDFEIVVQYLSQVGWRFGWTILVTGVAYALAAYAWLLCFTTTPTHLSFSKLFVMRQVGETLAVINPTSIVAGEASKIMMLRNQGVEYKEGVVSILLSRSLIFLSMFALLLLGAFLLFQTFDFFGNTMSQILFLIIMLVGFIGLLFSLVSSKLYLYRLVYFMTTPFSFLKNKNWLVQLKEVNQELHQFYLHHKGKLLLAFLFTLIHWILGGVEFYVLLNLLEIKVSIFDVILLEIGVAVVKVLGAFIPGQIGIEEYGNKLMLGIIGISDGGVWVAISVLRRARQLVWLVIGGVLFLFIYKNWKP